MPELEQVCDKEYGPKDVVFLDNKAFVRCIFDGCVIVHTGRATGFDKCLSKNCTFRFMEAASWTGKVFKAFDLLKPEAAQLFREGTEEIH